jgi:Kef-type K+ transport system membrane component KefB
MGLLINFLIYIVIFAIVAYGLYWICTKFGLPQPVLWLCGAILAGQLGGGTGSLSWPHLR